MSSSRLAALLDHEVGKAEHLQPAEATVEASLPDGLHGGGHDRLYRRTTARRPIGRWVRAGLIALSLLLVLRCGRIAVGRFVGGNFWRCHDG